MAISSELLSTISKARLAVEEDPYHDLAPGYQLAISKALGPCPTSDAVVSPWARRQLILAVSSVRKVLSHWDTCYPQHPMPHLLLAEAEKAFTLGWDYERVKHLAYRRYWDHFRGINQQDPAVFVLHAALAALSLAFIVVTEPRTLYESPVNYSLANDSLSIEEQSPAFLASLVSAGGPSWNRQSNNELRQDYWVWWLQEAVLKAYSDVVD